jgi:predicted PurR-regulated permease PerM
MRGAPLLNLVLTVALALMLGWILMAGRSLLLPVIAGAICVYVLVTAARGMGAVPVLRALPGSVRLMLLLGLFTLIVLALGVVLGSTVDDFLAAMPAYQANLEALSTRLADRLGYDLVTNRQAAVEALFDRIDLQAVFFALLGWLTRFGLTAFLIVVYAGFIMAERQTFATKLAKAFPDVEREKQLTAVFAKINAQIGHYLALKTLVNVILATICYVLLRLFDVDFPLFWAVVIGFSNYVPYVGSIIGVALPVTLSLAQFGSLAETVMLGLSLTAAQIAVGNFLDPWLMGRSLNLSPLVIIMSLSFWVTVWGVPGAILAIPMTAVLVITRFIAVMLTETGDLDAEPIRPQPIPQGAPR